jgi:hypothetical protein
MNQRANAPHRAVKRSKTWQFATIAKQRFHGNIDLSPTASP